MWVKIESSLRSSEIHDKGLGIVAQVTATVMAIKAPSTSFFNDHVQQCVCFRSLFFKNCIAYGVFTRRVSLYLDPQIRDWVLFPITLVMVRVVSALSRTQQFLSSIQRQILVGVLRHYVVLLLQSAPKKLSRAAIREQCVPFITDFDLPDR